MITTIYYHKLVVMSIVTTIKIKKDFKNFQKGEKYLKSYYESNYFIVAILLYFAYRPKHLLM